MRPGPRHDVRLDLIVTPERVIDCRRARRGRERSSAQVRWDELTEEKIEAIPLLRRLRAERPSGS